MTANTDNIKKIIETVARLRAPNGCPWDLEQTHTSLARYCIEEAYEVVEAIHTGDPAKLKDELGDLLLQVILHAQVAKDAGQFDIEDIAAAINEKMIRRHPHVFGGKQVDSAKEVLSQWEDLKDEERDSKLESAIDGVSSSLPALLQALKISEKAVSQGFEWENEGQVWDKLASEIAELREAIAHPDLAKPEKHAGARRDLDLEMGDVLFTLVNIGRWHGLNAEESLILGIDKFKRRFRQMEQISEKPLKDLSAKDLDALWNTAKKQVADHLL